MMRVRRMLSADGETHSADLASQSATLHYYVQLSTDVGVQPGIDKAYFYLGRGSLQEAAQEQERNPDADRRALRLAAASDGAPAALIAAALALPMDEGLDVDSVWTSLALALRERKDPAPYLAAIREMKIDETQQILDFITAVRTSTDRAEAERLLEGLDPVLRGRRDVQDLSCESRRGDGVQESCANERAMHGARRF